MSWGEDPSPDRLRPLNLGDVLDGMIRLARTHWRAFAIGLGVIVVPLTLISSLVAAQVLGTATPGFIQMLQNPELAESVATQSLSQRDVLAMAGTAALSGIAALFLTPLIYGIAVHIAATGYRSGTVDPMDSVRAAARRYLALLGTSLLVWVAPLLIFLLPVVLILIGAAVDSSGVMAAIGAFGFLISAVFALIAVVRLILAVPVAQIEQAGPLTALKRSNALVKGKTGVVLGSVIVIYIIVAIIGAILSWPFGLLGGMLGNEMFAIATGVGQMISSLLSYTLLGAALTLIYFDRRVRSEGYDLSEMAGELRQPPPDPAW